jgi:hypothetical protein
MVASHLCDSPPHSYREFLTGKQLLDEYADACRNASTARPPSPAPHIACVTFETSTSVELPGWIGHRRAETQLDTIALEDKFRSFASPTLYMEERRIEVMLDLHRGRRAPHGGVVDLTQIE